MYCTSCGTRNPDDARFCARCGEPIEQSEDTTVSMPAVSEGEDAPSLDGLGPDQALLVIKGGPAAGSTVLIDKDVTRAGRSPDSDVFLDDITVSRRHAEILREGGRFIVKDAGSLNGTYVNRERVDAAELSSGDELQIGRFKVVFYTAPTAPSATGSSAGER
jgi:pSer/pThr/pTyr-binding forkhead associated (FHA) protein